MNSFLALNRVRNLNLSLFQNNTQKTDLEFGNFSVLNLFFREMSVAPESLSDH